MNAVTETRAERPAPQALVRQQLEAMTPQFAMALPPHVPPERFVRIVMTAVQSNPDLLSKDRQSLFEASMKCAQDGLLPDGREAALVIHGQKVTYMPMVAGILSKVRRSGELRSIGAHVVYERDEFDYMLGDEERIHHKPYLGEDRGKPIITYAVAHTKDGGVYREVMTEAQVMAVKAISRAKNGPWQGPFADEMRRKTAIRRLSKRLPMSTDLLAVIERDDELYDLNKAQPVQVRRLHSGFEPEKLPAPDASPLGDDDIPDFPRGEGAEDPAPATDGDDPSQAGADDPFPGDQPSAGESEAAEPPQQEENTGSAAELAAWCQRFMDDLPGLSADQIKAIVAQPHEQEKFAALKETQPQLAMDLDKAIIARKRELAR